MPVGNGKIKNFQPYCLKQKKLYFCTPKKTSIIYNQKTVKTC